MSLRLSILLLLLAIGCTKKHPGTVLKHETAGMPAGSQLVVEKSGGFAFAATNPGKVYIQNVETGKVIFESPMKLDDRLIFDPKRKRIILEGTIVREDPALNEKQVHRLYFAKG